MSVNNLTVTFVGAAGTFTTQTDANGAYTIDLPAGTYTMSVSIQPEDGFIKTFDRAVITDIDQTSAVLNAEPIVDVDARNSLAATVDVYYNKTVSTGSQPPVSTTGSQNLDRTVDWRSPKILLPSMFGFTSNVATPTLEKIKITSLPITGELQLGGVAVTLNQEISVTAPSTDPATWTFSSTLGYYADQDIVTSNDDTFGYTVKITTNATFG